MLPLHLADDATFLLPRVLSLPRNTTYTFLSSYWPVNFLLHQSQEHILCGVQISHNIVIYPLTDMETQLSVVTMTVFEILLLKKERLTLLYSSYYGVLVLFGLGGQYIKARIKVEQSYLPRGS